MAVSRRRLPALGAGAAAGGFGPARCGSQRSLGDPDEITLWTWDRSVSDKLVARAETKGIPGAQIGAGQSYAGGVRQQIAVPAGTYKLSLFARTSGSLSAAPVTVTDAAGSSRTLNVPESSGWTRRELAEIPLSPGTATVTVRAASNNGYLLVDDLGLVKTSADTPPPSGQRYEAGAFAQFTVTSASAGRATLGVRFANGATSGARPANLVVNGSTVGTVTFESTGAWTTWTTKTVTVSLNAGSNTIRLDPTTAAGLPNVDHLDVGAAAG